MASQVGSFQIFNEDIQGPQTAENFFTSRDQLMKSQEKWTTLPQKIYSDQKKSVAVQNANLFSENNPFRFIHQALNSRIEFVYIENEKLSRAHQQIKIMQKKCQELLAQKLREDSQGQQRQEVSKESSITQGQAQSDTPHIRISQVKSLESIKSNQKIKCEPVHIIHQNCHQTNEVLLKALQHLDELEKQNVKLTETLTFYHEKRKQCEKKNQALKQQVQDKQNQTIKGLRAEFEKLKAEHLANSRERSLLSSIPKIIEQKNKAGKQSRLCCEVYL